MNKELNLYYGDTRDLACAKQHKMTSLQHECINCSELETCDAYSCSWGKTIFDKAPNGHLTINAGRVEIFIPTNKKFNAKLLREVVRWATDCYTKIK